MNSNIRIFAILLIGAAWSLPVAQAEPFSIQGFTGESSSLQALPGVRLDASGALAPELDCTEYQAPSFGARARTGGGTVRECSVGRFTFSTTSQENSFGPTIHNQYGRPPTTGWDVWRP